jgi:hypothetical protein
MKQAKPIFVIRVPVNYTAEEYCRLERNASSLLGSEYHLIFVQESYIDFKFELFNPNIELQDIDIDKLKSKLTGECLD